MLKRRRQAGDTLIEVLFAVTVFSLVVVGSISIMNQGANASERALEITLVRQQIDAQAESLRFLHDSYVSAYSPGATSYTGPAAEWAAMLAKVIANGQTSATSFGSLSSTCPTPPQGSFIINSNSATFLSGNSVSLAPASSYAQVDYTTNPITAGGIWIEAIRAATSSDVTQANAGYIDFHIMACWPVAGSTVPATIATIVRLYDPRG